MTVSEENTIIAWRELTQRIDDESLLRKIADMFLRDNGNRLQALEQAIEDGDVEAVRSLAHAIKGSAATMAAHPLARVAKELEFAAKAKESAVFSRLFTTLCDEYAEVNTVLSESNWCDRVRQKQTTD